MLRLAHFGGRAAGSAFRLYQIGRIEEAAAGFALIASRVFAPAFGTGAAHITVGQKHIAVRTKELLCRVLFDKAVRIEIVKNFLRNVFYLFVRRASEFVESDVKPIVYFRVQFIIVIAEFARRFALFERFRLGRRAVFVGTADVQRIVAPASAKACKDVG